MYSNAECMVWSCIFRPDYRSHFFTFVSYKDYFLVQAGCPNILKLLLTKTMSTLWYTSSLGAVRRWSTGPLAIVDALFGGAVKTSCQHKSDRLSHFKLPMSNSCLHIHMLVCSCPSDTGQHGPLEWAHPRRTRLQWLSWHLQNVTSSQGRSGGCSCRLFH